MSVTLQKRDSKLKIISVVIGSLLATCFIFMGISAILDGSEPISTPPLDISGTEQTPQKTAATATPSPAPVLPTFTLESTLTPFVLPSPSAQPVGVLNLPSCIRNQPQPATVVDVVDGDTIKVTMDGSIYSVRYIGIDTPESTIQHEYYGKEASQKNLELVGGKQITMYKDVSETDKYDRLLRYIFVGETFVNYELVSQGFANAKRYTPDTACAELFEQGENSARSLNLGFWSAQLAQPATQPASVPSTGGSLTIIEVNKSAEYVDIQNRSTTPVDLTGWKLLSEKGGQSCTLGGIIQSGATLRIYAASGQNGFNCNFSKNIWNNSESDPAILFNAQGVQVDRK